MNGAYMDSTTYLNQIKGQIKEITPSQVRDKIGSNQNIALIDIREAHEVENGVVPSAKTVSRGFLELKINSLCPDLEQQIILYCAGGNRSALSAKALQDMGYNQVYSMSGGYAKWQHAGFSIEQKKFLNTEQKSRYARHISMPEVGEDGQIKLLDTKVLLIGAGGLGSPAGLYLTAAGVGTLGLVDNDVVDRSNLQRQILHCEAEVDKPKVESAKRRMLGINPDINIKLHQVRLDRTNVMEIFKDYDIIVNGCDNFATRYLVNDACVFLKKPMVDGSIFRFEGQVTVFDPSQGGPCYRCLYPAPPPPEMAPSCQEAGVFGVLPGVIGVTQAIEVIKLAIGIGKPLIGKLVLYDALEQHHRALKIRPDKNCPVCSDNPSITELIDYEWFCSMGETKQ
ncbi:molybdopterin biosynthesis protein MoeB [bacterium K02(2017)]|nr:molybdopterin biosynthesis protein MoeB [bacterium K02(2017)]